MAAAALIMERTGSRSPSLAVCPRCHSPMAANEGGPSRCTECEYTRSGPATAPSVVIVDDNPDIRLILRHEFTKQGFEVVGEATNGRDAIEVAARTRPDFLVLDLMMPVMDGVEALPAIQVSCPRTHIVAFTSASEGDLAKSARLLGVAAVYDKGSEITTLPASLLRAAR